MKALKMVLKILIGLALIAAGVFSYLPKIGLNWWEYLYILFRGVAGIIVILIGLVFLALAKE